MSLNTENGIHLLSRLRPIDEAIDSEVMNKSMLFVINVREMDLIDANLFIHYICTNVLNKYSKYKPKDITNDSNGCNGYNGESYEEELMFEGSQEELVSSLTLSEESEDSMDTSDAFNPIVLILDAFEEFNLREFSKLVSNANQLKQIHIFKTSDDTQLLSAVSTELAINLGLNPNLRLVVIYANSSNICSKVVDKINRILFSLVISVPIVLVVETVIKINEYLSRDWIEKLDIKCVDWDTIEIMSNRYDDPVIRNITKPSFG